MYKNIKISRRNTHKCFLLSWVLCLKREIYFGAVEAFVKDLYFMSQSYNILIALTNFDCQENKNIKRQQELY